MNQSASAWQKAFLILAFLFGLAVLCLFVSDGQIKPDAQNAYYIGEQHPGYTWGFQRYGCLLALSVLLALAAAYLALGKGRSQGLLILPLLTLFLGLLFSRGLYYLSMLGFYMGKADVWAIFRLHEGGLSMSGALLGALMGLMLVYQKRKDTRLLHAAAVALAVFVLLARLAEHAAGTGYGFDVEFSGWFAILDLYGNLLRVWLIEALCALVILVYLLMRNKKCPQAQDTQVTVFFFLYGTTQVLMESLRTDRHMIWGFVKVQQIIAMLFAAGSLTLLVKRSGKPKRMLAALAVSSLVAALAFGLEKALDRLDVATALLYGLYTVLLAQYMAFAAWLVHKPGVR
ncbi:MAG: hypothetical protein GXZ04_00575 [Clostridiales bacterium]|nr:hypothetical protein [Clostridiales bacterium]